jgi:signal transduction histidine kinase
MVIHPLRRFLAVNTVEVPPQWRKLSMHEPFLSPKSDRSAALFLEAEELVHRRTDRLFAKLVVLQWFAAIGAALWISPRTWIGNTSYIHWHVWAAIFLGGFLASLPVFLVWKQPGAALTRHVIAVAQMLFSSLLIHLSGGRIETHFHVFGSLAFLACYRDWKVLATATVVVAADHLLRGAFWPQSIFGVLTPSYWRWLEHAGWVLFEDVVLMIIIRQSLKEMLDLSERQASLEGVNAHIEQKVAERTAELAESNKALVIEICERKRSEKERQIMEDQLRQSQKLESIGQLAAGIAHEINTPMQYIGDNTRFVKESFEAISKVLQGQTELLAAVRANAVTPELLASSEKAVAENDLNFLCAEIPSALAQSLEGVECVSKIVRAMKEFSHPGGKEKKPSDLNRAIESTITVAHNEWKYVAELNLELEPNLPLVPCYVSEFNQCILNLVVNAAHAIGDVVMQQPGTKGLITVITKSDGDHVEVRVTDTGTGIPEAARSKIFDPFFTTKEVGKGTGQGLSIVYTNIVKKHGGTVTFETAMGRGTSFILRLPIVPVAAVASS